MIENIRQLGQEIDWHDNDSIIRFYENNQLFFDNYKLLKNQDEIADVYRMKTHYINALNSKKRYSKALTVIQHLDFLLNKLEDNLELHEKFRIDRLFSFGMLKGNLKEYKESYSTFTELIRIDPENDLYKDWHIVMKMNLQYQYLKYGLYIGVAIVFGDIICDLAFGYKFNNRVVLFGFILMLASWLVPIVLKNLRKKGYIK